MPDPAIKTEDNQLFQHQQAHKKKKLKAENIDFCHLGEFCH